MTEAKFFASGLKDAFNTPALFESSFHDKEKVFKAIEKQKNLTVKQWDKLVDETIDDWRETWIKADKKEKAIRIQGQTKKHVEKILMNNNRKENCSCKSIGGCQKCIDVPSKGHKIIPTYRNPAFFGAIVEEQKLPDVHLEEDMRMGFEMGRVKETGNWKCKEEASKDWDLEWEKRQKKAEKAKISFPLEKPKVTEANVKAYRNMAKNIRKDEERGRYKLCEEKDLQNKHRTVIIRPIDQSYEGEDGELVEKYRSIWDGRGPNAEFSYAEQVRILNLIALREITLTYLSRSEEDQSAKQCSQKKKEAYENMLDEIEKRRAQEGKQLNNEGEQRNAKRRKYFQKQVARRKIEINLKSDSIEELIEVMDLVQKAILEGNEKLKSITIRTKSKPFKLIPNILLAS